MVWGERYARYLPEYLKRLHELHVESYLILAHDEESHLACVAALMQLPLELGASGGSMVNRCVRAGKGSVGSGDGYGVNNPGSRALGKFSLSLLLLQHGFDVVYVDFDTFMFENPVPLLQREAGRLSSAAASASS